MSTEPSADNCFGNPRRYLESLYHAALDRVDGRRCVAGALPELALEAPIGIVAIGKATAAMAEGAFAALHDKVVAALIITKYGHLSTEINARSNVEAIEAGHPFPDEASLEAGRRLLTFLRNSSSDTHLLFLISGGASSLVEVPAPSIDLALLRRANQWLIGSGLDIAQVNRVRKALSKIKGGGLLYYLDGRKTQLLLMSDVPGDQPENIGSGLLTPAAAQQALPALPDWLTAALADQPPAPDARPVATQIVVRNADAKDAVRTAVGDAYPVHVVEEPISGDAARCGQRLARTLIDAPAGIYVWGGETTVELPPEPGRGGRCQHLALAAAIELAGCDDIFLLAAGTDGSDGPTEEAGALVDGATIARGMAKGLSAHQSLKSAGAGRFLEASGDLIRTGPTGTNVMDIVIGLRAS